MVIAMSGVDTIVARESERLGVRGRQFRAASLPGVNCIFLISVSATAIGQEVDLTIAPVDTSSLVADYQTLSVRGTVAANVENSGSADVTADTRVAFFEDENGNGHYEPGVDLLLGTDLLTGGVVAGGVALASASVEAKLAFGGNLIYAFVDSEEAIPESDESNNISNSGESCLFAPSAGSFNPVLEWSWTGTAASPVPNHTQVMMTPLVANLTDDNLDGFIDDNDVPDVVFSAFAASAATQDGVIVALNGDDGSEIFITDLNAITDVDPTGQLAIGDIDGDGFPEIVANADVTDEGLNPATHGRLIAFEHDGSLAFVSPDTVEKLQWGGASLVDINQDGVPEIVVGRHVLDNRGTLLASGTSHSGVNGVGPLSTMADIDGNGSPELIAGASAYTVDLGSDGTGITLFWQTAGVGDGFPAIANFDADNQAEVALVSSGAVWLLDGADGTVIWGPRSIPSTSYGGPPAVADYDGDDKVEVGVAGSNTFTVFDNDGTTLWENTIQDLSSGRASSAAFDFDGDGAAEAVYRDEQYLWVFNGADGAVLLQIPLTSAAALENPVVADVDKDGNAEIIVGANDYLVITGGDTGLRVYGDANDNWVNARRIWNQHTYHITNVDDDGSIPTSEKDNWSSYNNFRAQEAGNDAEIFAAPDLTASYLGYATSPATITARIGNGGAVIAPAGTPVSFYDGDPMTGGSLLGTAETNVNLLPGEYEDVSLSLATAFDAQTRVYVIADDPGDGGGGTESECDEANNAHAWSFGPCEFDSILVIDYLELDHPETFQACSVVKAGSKFEVLAGGKATLRSGERVILGGGVSVHSGGEIAVEIDGTLTSP